MGIFSDYFIKTGLPPSKAGRPILKASQKGKFHGRMSKDDKWMVMYLGWVPRVDYGLEPLSTWKGYLQLSLILDRMVRVWYNNQ